MSAFFRALEQAEQERALRHPTPPPASPSEPSPAGRHGAEMTSKRALDLCGAVLALLVSLPLLAIVAAAVRLDSSGPVLFTQLRVGRRGRLFRLYKFRSMIAQPAVGSPITGGGDGRVTRVGRIIRPLRIDELPQLINVLKGDMSLVGPRPEAPSIVEQYTPEQREVLEVRPGITGPTQLAWLDESDRLPAGADPTEYYVSHILPRKLTTDLHYVRTHTVAADIRILVKTPLRLGYFMLGRPRLGRMLKVTRLLTDFTSVGVATYLAFFARFDGDIPQPSVWILIRGPSVRVRGVRGCVSTPEDVSEHLAVFRRGKIFGKS